MIKIAVSLFPVFLFLSSLVFLDSYKLVRFRSILVTILAGCVAAVVAFFLNTLIIHVFDLDLDRMRMYIGPQVEELIKAAYFVYIVKSKRVGFVVDAAIYGFAIGAGFALLENVYYLWSLSHATLFTWIIRGLGTAVMHGGTTAICCTMSKNLSDRNSQRTISVFIPGLLVATAIHAVYNHFFFSPFISTIILLVFLPVVFLIVFDRSEKATETWLKTGLDTDVQILDMIMTETLAETNVGMYLQSLKGKFSGEILVDMLCMLRLHLELSIRAKGILLMRQSGFEPAIDPQIRQKFSELRYLEKSLGVTGKLAMAPLLHTSSRDLWQLYMLQNQ